MVTIISNEKYSELRKLSGLDIEVNDNVNIVLSNDEKQELSRKFYKIFHSGTIKADLYAAILQLIDGEL